MNYNLIDKDDKRYIEYISNEKLISKETDAMDLIAACFENNTNNTNLLIIHDETLSEDFFNLRTGLAGAILQKLVNYNIKVAIIIANEENLNDRFREMIIEANKRDDYRAFKSITDAENWILT